MNRFVLSVALLLSMTCANSADGQTNAYHFSVAGDSLTSNVPMNEINPRAFRHFERDFGEVPATNWFKNDGGYYVTFTTSDSTHYYVYISRHGSPYKTVVYFSPASLPPDLKAIIFNLYAGCTILYAAELQYEQRSQYEVCLLENSREKIIDVYDGEIRTTSEFNW